MTPSWRSHKPSFPPSFFYCGADSLAKEEILKRLARERKKFDAALAPKGFPQTAPPPTRPSHTALSPVASSGPKHQTDGWHWGEDSPSRAAAGIDNNSRDVTDFTCHELILSGPGSVQGVCACCLSANANVGRGQRLPFFRALVLDAVFLLFDVFHSLRQPFVQIGAHLRAICLKDAVCWV